MAIYHFSAKVISRTNGSSAVAAAAYRSASRLHDERLDRAHDFTNKAGVVHSEVLLPENAPEAWKDQATLWNAVEAGEARKDAQLAREVEFAIPRELSKDHSVALAREFVQREFVDRGMVADLNVHWDTDADGQPKPHAHVMLTMREVTPRGEFGAKVRDWNATELLTHWRESWAEHVNERLADLGIDMRVDHRSFKDQGIELEPQDKIGPAGARRLDRGEAAERALEHREIARRNGDRIIQDPNVALNAITHQQATFTNQDLARFIHRQSDDKDQFDRAISAVKTSPELVLLGRDGLGRDRFTSREMMQVEERLERSASIMADDGGHGVGLGAKRAALHKAEDRGLTLSDEQRDAFDHVTGRARLSLVVGYAGSGKSAMLGVARDAWEAQGYRVQGAALSGIAAENLEGGSAIPSRTLASLEHGWARDRDVLTDRDVLVIDEAGLVGSRQMQRVLDHAEAAGAKVVMVGDAEQLQAIEAGAAFRALTERHGAAEISQIRRQREEEQRQATRQLATGRTDEALAVYEARDMVHGHESKALAREALVEGWAAERKADSRASRVILAYTRDDVSSLNTLARDRLKLEGELGPDQGVQTARGERSLAAGDRVMFLKNERSMGVKNGTLGTVEGFYPGTVAVRLDDGRSVTVDLKAYNDIDHGYASTIHKSQGVTVDRAHVLASGHMDRHAAYVALSRHRDGVELHYSRDEFATRSDLVRTLGRDRPKDMALDYRQEFAERRDIREAPAMARSRGLFEGFRPRPTPELDRSHSSSWETQSGLDAGIRTYAKAFADVERVSQLKLPVLPHQEAAMDRAAKALSAIDKDAARDLRSALARTPGLAGEIDQPGRRSAILQAMALEREVRTNPERRADRFVENWTQLKADRARLTGWRYTEARDAVERRMQSLADGLHRDPQLESVLANRRRELGLHRGSSGHSLEHDLTRSLGIDRGLGL